MTTDPRVAPLAAALRSVTAEDGWPKSMIGIPIFAAAILAALDGWMLVPVSTDDRPAVKRLGEAIGGTR